MTSLAFILVFLLGVRTASATPISWKFSGLLGPEGAAVLLLPASSPFEWVVHLDFKAFNLCDPGSDQGFYSGIGSGTLRVGNSQWTGGPGTVEVNTIQGACGGPSPTGVSFRQFGWTATNGFPLVPLALVGSLNYPTRLDGTMPGLPPPDAIVSWSSDNLFDRFDVQTGVGPASPVPEPATLSLLGSGAVMMMWRRRRNRSTAADAKTIV